MALQKSRHNYKSDDLLKLPAISNELSVTRKEDLKYSYAIPFSFCLLPASMLHLPSDSNLEGGFKLLLLSGFETEIV